METEPRPSSPVSQSQDPPRPPEAGTPPRPRRGRPPKNKSLESSPTRTTSKNKAGSDLSSDRMRAIKELADDASNVVIAAMSVSLTIEQKKQAAMGLCSKAGSAQLAKAFVKWEPYAEWVALGIGAVVFGVCSAVEILGEMFGKPAKKEPEKAPESQEGKDNGPAPRKSVDVEATVK